MTKTKIVVIVRNILERIVEVVTMAMFLVLLLIGIYAFIDAGNVTQGGVIDKELLAAAPEYSNDTENPLKDVQDINPDIIGWVKIYNTGINHPVLYSFNNTDYLVRNYRKEYSTAGSAFVDYRNDKFRDDFTVVYGHRMSDGLMFSDITKYVNREFFDQHLTGRLWTEDGNYDLEIVGFGIFDVGVSKIYNLDTYRLNSDAAYKELEKTFVFTSDYKYKQGDKLLMLSTCDSSGRQKRDILLARMIKR